MKVSPAKSFGTISGAPDEGTHAALPAELHNHGPKPPLYWRHVFVPVDFSEESRQALKIAAGLAEQSGAKLTVLHVVGLPAASFTDAPVDVEDLMIASRDSMEKMCGDIPRSLIQAKLVEFGREDILHQIIQTALDLPADVMVVASHGRGGLSRLLHPCISDKILRHVSCPVLIINAKSGSPECPSSRSLVSPNPSGK